MPPKTLNLRAVARYLGLDPKTIYNMLKDGRFSVAPIPDVHPRRWNVEDIDAWRNVGSQTTNAGA